MLWIKLTIIFGIIAICSHLLLKFLVAAMEPDERLALAMGFASKKVIIPVCITILSGIASVVCLIITIVTL